MKNKLIVTAILVCSFIFVSEKSFSQNTNKRYFWSLGAGAAFPVNTLSNNYSTGFEIGGKAGYVFTNTVASGFSIDVNSFDRKQYNNPAYYISGGNANLISIRTFLLAGNLKKDVKLKPYFILGAGLYLNRSTNTYTTFGVFANSQYASSFGLDIGGGLSYKVSNKASIFIEPKFAGTFDPLPVEFFSIKTGVNFGQ